MKELYEYAIELAERAGEITLEYFRTDIDIEQKADDSPVTIADRKAEEFLRQEIEKRFPDDAILGEEFGEKPGTSGRRWILDPIDGTKTFIRGVAMYGTQIGIEENGNCQIGVIRYPPNQQTLSAMENYGCYCNGRKCRVSLTDDIKQSAVSLTAFDSFLNRWGKDTLIRLLNETGMQRTWGDCYGYLLLVTGRMDIMIDSTLQIWDAAPLLRIVQEAGGKITDSDGNASLNVKNIIASNGLLHQAIMNLLTSC